MHSIDAESDFIDILHVYLIENLHDFKIINTLKIIYAC